MQEACRCGPVLSKKKTRQRKAAGRRRERTWLGEGAEEGVEGVEGNDDDDEEEEEEKERLFHQRKSKKEESSDSYVWISSQILLRYR
ncbi:hypothetical protein C4D60_Mb11t20120 [Musa balbisiana]|uniref:Uncharacterized protein n=1 Tax=Musa balbisiana TaxID=52838 RepID=A0A4S8J737_MUSBA|nr:hypothetical protein C4D60_Mb11t20120 [Musa balbisiana]